MELTRLEKYKRKYQEFNSKISSLQKVLGQLNNDHVSVITPYYISKKLSIPELDAFFLLSLAELEHIVDKKYKVLASDDDYLLGEFDDKSEIPDSIYNNANGKKVKKDDFYIDVVFELK